MGVGRETHQRRRVNATEKKERAFPAAVGMCPSSGGIEMNNSTTRKLYIYQPFVRKREEGPYAMNSTAILLISKDKCT